MSWKQQIFQILPGRKRFMHFVGREIIAENRKRSQQPPHTEILAKHLAETTLLANRQILLDHLPKGGIVAELGVDEGHFSQDILNRCMPDQLHLIDQWSSPQYDIAKKEMVAAKFDTEIASGQVKVHVGDSCEVLERMADHLFDWIYIDTDHTYDTTRRELEVGQQKIKPGGIIAGHDFISGNWNHLIRYGVIEAVYEFCVNHNWKIIFLTMELNGHPSFALQKSEH